MMGARNEPATKDPYIPALQYGWLAPLYDPFLRLMGDVKMKRSLLEASAIQDSHRVLDLGCGTGTLLEMTKAAYPGTRLSGLDGDSKILRIAGNKIRKHDLQIGLIRAMAYQLPYPDDCFDRVLSSLVIHHLSPKNKLLTFREILRVLRPGGKMIVADFGPPVGHVMKVISLVMSHHEQIKDNIAGLLPSYAKEGGFVEVEMLSPFNTIFGTIWILRAAKQPRTSMG